MRKLKFFLSMGIIVQLGCGVLGSPVQSTPESDAPTQALILPSETASALPTLTPSATVEPTLIPPPAIASESFGQAQVLHEYWPVIREAAGLWETARFGMSQTAWELSPDGRLLAIAGCDAEAGNGAVEYADSTDCEETIHGTTAHAYLFILDASTESIIATLPETGQELTVERLSFTHDGKKLVYGLDSGTVKIWDIASAAFDAVIGEESPVSPFFEISPDDKWIVFPTEAQNWDTQNVWDIAQKKFVNAIPGREGAIFSPDGQKLLVFNYPVLSIYSTNTWQKVIEQVLMPDGIKNTYEISPDFSLLAMCDTRLGDTPLKIWDVATAELIQSVDVKGGRCARLVFSPDGRLLLRFDEHGAGPLVWEVEGWKLVQSNANMTTFVKSGDLFVSRLDFAQDGASVLVGTFERLTLYELPRPAGTAAPIAQPAGPSTISTGLPTPQERVVSCDFVVSGSMNLHVQPCQPPSYASGGRFDGITVDISMKSYSDFTGVVFSVPLALADRLKPGEYLIGEAAAAGYANLITARFDYHDPKTNHIVGYTSYEGGTLTLTQTGAYISGSFEFGARDMSTKQIHVIGSFENIPFSRVNLP